MPRYKRKAHVAFYADESVSEETEAGAIVLFFSKSKDRGDLRGELGDLNWRRVLSNFYDSRVTLGGVTYPTAEHAYHAAKYGCTNKPELAAMFAIGATCVGGAGAGATVTNDPKSAKVAGGRRGMTLYGVTLDTSAWMETRDRAMHAICEARWQQDPTFRKVLRAVVARGWYLLHFERSGSRSFWGGFEKEGRIEGRNALGEILMGLATRHSGEEEVECAVDAPGSEVGGEG